MYYFKENVSNLIKKKYKARYIAEESGITETYLSLILNRKKHCPKRTALMITKSLDHKSNIEDYFEKK